MMNELNNPSEKGKPIVKNKSFDQPFSVQDLLKNFSLKSFDIYSKVEEDYRVQTSNGALLSIIGWIVIALLSLGEIRNYMTPIIKEHMQVDQTFGQQLSININISFHALNCAQVHVDAMDIAGDNQLNIEQSMFKQRLSADGRIIGDKSNQGIGKNIMKPMDKLACGSCFGAESAHRRCCNTCDELRQAYDEMNWNAASVLRTAEQCTREKQNPLYGSLPGEGCQVAGTMRVNKVGGNFHVAHGDSIIRDGRHIHMFNPIDAPGYNISHTIHSVSFGETYRGMPSNPLDGVSRIVVPEVGTGLFQYFIKVIPTVYTDSSGNIRRHSLLTNQYTFTEKFRAFGELKVGPNGEMIPTAGTVLPGMFFIYELSPFMVQVQHQSMPFTHLLSRLCAIVGGIFTVLGVIDTGIFRLATLLRVKLK